jgi:hypothetical protein
MAKKSRRVRRKGEGTRLSETQMAQPTQVAAVATVATPVPEAKPDKQTADADLKQEYQYVVSDLRRLGLLAAAILGSMLILYIIL